MFQSFILGQLFEQLFTQTIAALLRLLLIHYMKNATSCFLLPRLAIWKEILAGRQRCKVLVYSQEQLNCFVNKFRFKLLPVFKQKMIFGKLNQSKSDANDEKLDEIRVSYANTRNNSDFLC